MDGCAKMNTTVRIARTTRGAARENGIDDHNDYVLLSYHDINYNYRVN